MWFFNFDFFNFFFDFSRFWLDFGRPWALQKLKKIIKNRFFIAFSFEGGFWEGSGRVLGGFWEGFGRILGGFWEGFGKVLDGFWEDFALESRIAFGETCVEHFRLKTLL